MNWSKRIRVVFDRKVYNVTSSLKGYFRLAESIYGTYIYPTDVTYGANDQEIYLEFNDFYRAIQPLSLEYLGGTSFGGKDFAMEAFTLAIEIRNVNPSDADEFLIVSDVSVSGEITLTFDGKLYTSEYLQLASINVSGTNISLSYYKQYASEYLQIASISVAGQYCDVNGIPL